MHAGRPYQYLYVYLINGLVSKRDEAIFGDSFLGNWVEDNSSFLFFKRPANEAVASLLNIRPGLELIDDYKFSYEEWHGGGLDTIRIGNFLIMPPWAKTSPSEGEIQILADPGVVFGNGLHPTTRDCLRALSYARRQRPFERVLDFGTGTGLLALAAGFLGAKEVLAVDLNPLCVKTAMENVRLNDLDKTIQVVEGPAEDFVDEPADVMVANIRYDVVETLLSRRNFNDKERVIVSGLMRSQAREIKIQLERCHFQIQRVWDHEMTWFTILAERGYKEDFERVFAHR